MALLVGKNTRQKFSKAILYEAVKEKREKIVSFIIALQRIEYITLLTKVRQKNKFAPQKNGYRILC